MAETVTAALAIGVLGLVVMFVLQRVLPKVPSVLVAVVVSIVVANLFDVAERGVDLVGTLPQGFPPLTVPDVERLGHPDSDRRGAGDRACVAGRHDRNVVGVCGRARARRSTATRR